MHLLDTTIRRGEPGPLPPPELPTVPGREVAGVVDDVGRGPTAPGSGSGSWRTSARCPGGYAEQAVTAVDKLFDVPDHVPFPDAVAAVGTGRTALGVLELEPADRGRRGAGAVGRRWAGLAAGAVGARRPVRRSSRPLAATRGRRSAALGAHLVVDYGEAGWDEQVRAETGGVSLVYDGVGGEVGRQSPGAAAARAAGW